MRKDERRELVELLNLARYMDRKVNDLSSQMHFVERKLREIERLLHPHFHPTHIVLTQNPQGAFPMPTQTALIGATPGSTVTLTLHAADASGNFGAFPDLATVPTVVSDNPLVVPTVGTTPNGDGSWPVSVVVDPTATPGETANLTATQGVLTSGAVPFPTDAVPFVAASIVVTQP